MFSKFKGQFGYLRKQPVRVGIFTVVLLFMCAAVFLTGYILKGDVKNIFTVVAVLGTLPVAKMIVSFIMYLKAEKFTCKKETYERVEKVLSGKDVEYGYDFYLTSYKTNFAVSSCAVFDGSMILLYPDGKEKNKELREHVEKYLNNNSITQVKVYVLESEDKYIERLKSADPSYHRTETDTAAITLIKNLSL